MPPLNVLNPVAILDVSVSHENGLGIKRFTETNTLGSKILASFKALFTRAVLILMSALTCLFETILKERKVLSHVLF